MFENLTRYERPTSLGEAVARLRMLGPAAAVIAGGTDLVVQAPAAVTTLIDIMGLSLDRIERGPEGVRIGATATLSRIAESPLLPQALREAAYALPSWQLRNRATIAGRVLSAGPNDDLLTVLLALDARLHLTGTPERTIALEDLLDGTEGVGKEIVTAIDLPQEALAARNLFLRVARIPSDAAIVTLAISGCVEGTECRRIRVAAGGVAERILRLRGVEAAVSTLPRTPEAIRSAAEAATGEISPPSDFRGSRAYRAELLQVLLQRGITAVLGGDEPREVIER
ncbi:MAG: hypothetical protein D6812_10365 [Deltaproteobacteria bacterium]|nr:MAG: hypothetical protein D6812_10365 [Deltaproteobacteria bacterium]